MNNFTLKNYKNIFTKVIITLFILAVLVSGYSFWYGQEINWLKLVPFARQEYIVKPKIDSMNYEEKKAILEFIKQRYKEGKETRNAFGNGLSFDQYVEKLALNDSIDFYNLVNNLNNALRDSPYFDFQRKYNYNMNLQLQDNSLLITSQDQIKSDFQYKIPTFKEYKTKVLPNSKIEIIGLKCDLNTFNNYNIIDISYIALNQKPKSNLFNVSCSLNDLEPGKYFIKQQIENIDYMYKPGDSNYWLQSVEIK